ncbi:MAG: GNAT family N-acetyltransferase, partial [Actinomycetota bacterium]|nr:GNAT family N-acetyltransferase [Actinomycetota bacterium]
LKAYCEPLNSTMLLAEADGCVVGLLGLLGRMLPQEAHVGSLGISVERDHRGCGIGTRLIERLFEWAPQHGVRRIEVEAFANNPDAIRLYQRLGFEREGVRRDAVTVDGEYVDAVLLAKLLT